MTTIDGIPKLPTERHFLALSKTCFYMVHLGLRPFFRKLVTYGYLKSNSKTYYGTSRANIEVPAIFIDTL